MKDSLRRFALAALVLACVLPGVTLPMALLLGLAFALVIGNPLPEKSATVQKYTLQLSVVGLGFGTPFGAVLNAGTTGISITAAVLSVTLVLGWLLGRALRVDGVTGQLIAAGTAICGGSAIVALGPVLGARPAQMAAALGCVFLLNAVALYALPAVGHWAALSPEAFGYWAAIAIHDTSSVVGAAAQYEPPALALAVSLKLARALWILPMVAAVWFARRRTTSMNLPWFIVGFALASACAATWPAGAPAYGFLTTAAHSGLAVALFLTGAALSSDVLRQIGWRPFLQGLVLWILVSAVSLWVLLRIGVP